MNASAVPSKATIQGSFRSKSTLRTYRTYQKQFAEYCKQLPGVEPEAETPSVCTDFFHHLYSQGKTARTVDSAKTALVAFFHDLKVIPNPARDVESKQYVVGLQKYNKKNNIDDENKAHPLSVNELSCLVNSFSTSHLFLGLQGTIQCSPAFGPVASLAPTRLAPAPATKPATIPRRQATLDSFVLYAVVPTARSAMDAWNQWFTGDPQLGLFQPLRSFTKEMIRADRRKYSERLTLSKAFAKYVSYDMFESAYEGHTSSYSNTLSEVRKRKREGRL
ncbi:hypothetical protein DYB31_008489 [Aphanomyces astaci]|uniref:Core-binding (CB) domain-containing protein n=1 Tax=Aphanomyces astaci TaxID=112090 RepID=A0A397FCK4_APHAT|nr:hypothetical protein DYB31_008489 [Aphanomyces astaci]